MFGFIYKLIIIDENRKQMVDFGISTIRPNGLSVRDFGVIDFVRFFPRVIPV